MTKLIYMNLQPMTPTPYASNGELLTVYCSACYKPVRSDLVLCDTHAEAGTFYCKSCADSLTEVFV